MIKTPDFGSDPFDKNTPEGAKNLAAAREYHTEMGRFIHVFAGVEMILFTTLGLASNIPNQMARALFTGIRAKEAMDLIRNVLEARSKAPAKYPALEADLNFAIPQILPQIAVINGMRNLLLHHGALDPHLEEPVVSNWARARSDRHLNEVKISKTDLDNMTEDIALATYLLAQVANRLIWPLAPFEPSIRATLASPPWRYKSPLQGGKKDTPPKKPPKRKPPLRS